MRSRRSFLKLAGVGSLTALAGCSTIRDKVMQNDIISMKLSWTPTGPNSYRFILDAVEGDTAFVNTEDVAGKVTLVGEETCQREDCIYEFKEVGDTCELKTTDTTSGDIKFKAAKFSDKGDDMVKTIYEFDLETEQLKKATESE